MKKHDCIVGIEYDYEDSFLVTIKDLKEIVKEHNESVEATIKYNLPAVFEFEKEKIELKDFFKKEMLVGVEIFNYCPICGKKIEFEEKESEE